MTLHAKEHNWTIWTCIQVLLTEPVTEP